MKDKRLPLPLPVIIFLVLLVFWVLFTFFHPNIRSWEVELDVLAEPSHVEEFDNIAWPKNHDRLEISYNGGTQFGHLMLNLYADPDGDGTYELCPNSPYTFSAGSGMMTVLPYGTEPMHYRAVITSISAPSTTILLTTSCKLK